MRVQLDRGPAPPARIPGAAALFSFRFFFPLSELARNTDGVTRAWGGVDARFRAASCLFSTHAQLRTMPVFPTHRIDLALCGICWAEKQHQSRLGDDFGCHIRGSHVTATPGLKFLLNAKAAT